MFKYLNLQSPIARSLVIITIMVSAAMALMITTLQISDAYKSKLHDINHEIEQVQYTYLPSIAESVWFFDEDMTNRHMESALRIPDIEHISIAVNGERIKKRGFLQSSQILTREFPMTVVHNNETIEIGVMTVIASLDNLYASLINFGLLTLLANILKTLVVAGIMLMIFNYLVTRHIYSIADYVKRQDFNIPMVPLDLHRKKHPDDIEKDELNQLENSINAMVSRLYHSHMELGKTQEQLEETVLERTEELIYAKDQAVRANDAKTEFLARMNHELRTPLNSVLGFAQILEVDNTLNEHQKVEVGHILTSGKHLLAIINELIDLSSIEAGNAELHMDSISIKQILDESLTIIRPISDSHHIKITNQVAKQEDVLLYADSLRVKQILINLLANAVKYNQSEGKINIAYSFMPDNRLRINIQDNGPGLSHEQRARLFEPFSRVGAEYSGIEGAGLGLSITKRLVELMSGTIGVTSKLGEGSCFYFDLPIANPKGNWDSVQHMKNRKIL